MKSIVRFLSIAVIATVAFSACNKDNTKYNGQEDPAKSNIGYLALGGMEASVLEDTENVNTETRAGGVDINTFDVTITNTSDEVVKSFKYGARPTDAIELEAGVYTIAMSSTAMAGAEWETPVYGAER
jgi:hypothetical protein